MHECNFTCLSVIGSDERGSVSLKTVKEVPVEQRAQPRVSFFSPQH